MEASDQLKTKAKTGSASYQQMLAEKEFSFSSERILNELVAEIPDIDTRIKPSVPPHKVRDVLIFGVANRNGELLLYYLYNEFALARRSSHSITCIVPADTDAIAKDVVNNILLSRLNSKSLVEEYMGHIKVLSGNFEEPYFGLIGGETQYQKLCETIESVYVSPDYTVEEDFKGLNQKLSLFNLRKPLELDSLIGLMRFASTYRFKHIHYMSSVLRFPEIFIPDISGSRIIHAHETSANLDSTFMKDFQLSPHNSIIGCHVWCRAIAEELLSICRKSGFPIFIYRLPPTFLYQEGIDNVDWILNQFVRPSSIGWKLLFACFKEGLIPTLANHVWGLIVQPIDIAIKMTVQLSLSSVNVHWCYNVVNEKLFESFTLSDFLSVLNSHGVYLERISWDDFLGTLRNLDSISNYLPDLEAIGSNLSSITAKVIIGNHNLSQDMSNVNSLEVAAWPDATDSLWSLILVLMQYHVFSPDSKAALWEPEHLEREAIKLSGGLTDYGEDGKLHLEGWSRFLYEIKVSPSKATFVGRCSASQTAIVYLTTLLYMCDAETNDPSILDEEIEAPTIIVGMNRAATTFLQTLLSADTDTWRTTVLLEMLYPYGPKGNFRPKGIKRLDRQSWDSDPRAEPALKLIDIQTGGRLKHILSTLHARRVSAPDEDLVLFEMIGRSYTFCAGFGVPSYREWLLKNNCAEIAKGFGFHKRFLKHLQHQRPGGRWLLKCPFHLLCIDELMRTYPDAELIFLHRLPNAAISSWCGVERLLQAHFICKEDPLESGKAGLDLMKRLIDNVLTYQKNLAIQYLENQRRRLDSQDHRRTCSSEDARGWIPLTNEDDVGVSELQVQPPRTPQQRKRGVIKQPPLSFFLNVYFEDVTAEPIAEVTRIYDLLGLELTPKAEKLMWESLMVFWQNRALASKIECTLEQVGLTEEQVEDTFSEYVNTYFGMKQKPVRLAEYKLAKAIRRNENIADNMYTSLGTMVKPPDDWIGLELARRKAETLWSYARCRLIP